MTYQTLQYLTESDTAVSLPDAVAWIKQHCPKLGQYWLYNPGKYYLLRGVQSDLPRIVDAPARQRTARNTSDFYRAMHDEVNDKFPARAKSMSLTNAWHVADSYGQVAWVFLPDNAEVAVLDAYDFWGLSTSKWNDALSDAVYLGIRAVKHLRDVDGDNFTSDMDVVLDQLLGLRDEFSGANNAGHRRSGKATTVDHWSNMLDKLHKLYQQMLQNEHLSNALARYGVTDTTRAEIREFLLNPSASGKDIIDSLRSKFEYGDRVKLVPVAVAASTMGTTVDGNEMWAQSVHLLIPHRYHDELKELLTKEFHR